MAMMLSPSAAHHTKAFSVFSEAFTALLPVMEEMKSDCWEWGQNPVSAADSEQM
jgi:hypothetical protein